jgi:CheY-like chemotaxis protein
MRNPRNAHPGLNDFRVRLGLEDIPYSQRPIVIRMTNAQCNSMVAGSVVGNAMAADLNETETIAIIDDDAAVRSATRGLLRSLGFAVSTFATAEEFLDSTDWRSTACVITDLRMPGMGGAELLNRLVAQEGSPPVIVITSFPEERMEERLLAAGARGFLTKPYHEQRLVDCLRSAMSK